MYMQMLPLDVIKQTMRYMYDIETSTIYQHHFFEIKGSLCITIYADMDIIKNSSCCPALLKLKNNETLDVTRTYNLSKYFGELDYVIFLSSKREARVSINRLIITITALVLRDL